MIADMLHTRGLNSLLPMLRTRKALNRPGSGDVLEVTASDPDPVKDMASFCKQTGHRVLSSGEVDNTFVFMIERR